jgi:hypothetical protein
MVERHDRLDLSRFEDLVDRYGGDLEKWPADLRADAEAFCAGSDEAAEMCAAARRLDALLAAPSDVRVSPALAERILAAAPKPVPEPRMARTSRPRPSLLERLWPFGPVWRPAAALAGAALLGVIFGYSVPAPTDTGFAFEVASVDEVVEYAVGLDQDLEVVQ